MNNSNTLTNLLVANKMAGTLGSGNRRFHVFSSGGAYGVDSANAIGNGESIELDGGVYTYYRFIGGECSTLIKRTEDQDVLIDAILSSW